MRATREEILKEADRYYDWITKPELTEHCLLYTSDAADE